MMVDLVHLDLAHAAVGHDLRFDVLVVQLIEAAKIPSDTRIERSKVHNRCSRGYHPVAEA